MLETKYKFDEHIIISGGDFNVCLTSLDQLNRKSTAQERELARVIVENNKLIDLNDSYRSIHPTSGFTWKRAMTFSRLDYIFVSKEVLTNITSAKVDWAFENSDHAAVIISVKIDSETIKGPGTTKLNVEILNNPAVVKKI
jgi:exonuclease III